jgi:hypothetical protein
MARFRTRPGRVRLARLTILALAFVALPYPHSAVRAQAGLSLSIINPDGQNDRVAAGRDYATEILGDPWDMNDPTDFDPDEKANVSNDSYANGVYSGNAANNDPNLYLLEPGLGGTQRNGRTGKNFPIDTTNYRIFSFRMNVSAASSFQVFWFTGDSFVSNFAGSAFIQTTPGWRVYTVDLANVQIVSGDTGSWSGQPATGLRLDPTTVSGSTFQIDWVRLTAPDDATTTFPVSINPADPGANAVMNFYLDADGNFANGYDDQLATGLREDSTTIFNAPLARYAPGDYRVVGRLSRDYASLYRENAWDMSESTDVASSSGFSSATVSGGVFSGTSNSVDPLLFLASPSTGPDRIDASIFRSVSFQMSLSAPSSVMVFWKTADNVVHGSGFQGGVAGSAIYTFNLGADPTWTGLVTEFRIDPCTAAGITVSIDWVSVHTGPNALTGVPTTVTASSPGPLSINTPPIAHLLQPDAMGGLDYAAAVRTNPWNMAESSDVALTTGFAPGTPAYLRDTIVEGVRGDYLRGLNPAGNDDPAIFFVNNVAPFVDANKFKNLTFRMSITGPRDIGLGSVARVFWQTTTAGAQVQTSDDIIVNAGLNSYVFDLTKIVKEPTAPGNDGVPWGGTVKIFRIDPHEFSAQREFFVDDVKLAADDEANGRFAITWSDTDVDDDATITLFRDTNDSGFDGVQIATGISEDAARDVLVWNTSGVPNGTYFLYAAISDGLNTTRRYATGRLVVANATAPDATAPIGALETANTVTSSSGIVDVRGWTLDNVQVASVELLVDDVPVALPSTRLFRPDIRDQNPTMPDASQAGFQMFYDPSGLPPGTHSLSIGVYDTAGNRSVFGASAPPVGDTPGIFISSSGAWFLRNSNSGGAADVAFGYGPSPSSLVPLTGDWNGDGVETPGLYDPATAAFFLRNSNSSGAADITFTFGPGGLGWKPIRGDWDGNGTDTIGLYDPVNGVFFIRNSNTNGPADSAFGFGPANVGWLPLAGDWNGDGADTIGLFNPTNASFFLKNTNASGPADVVFNYGPGGATPIVGDWNNDGMTTIAVYVPATAAWFLRNTNGSGGADIVFVYGPSNATPLAGDWNGAP